MFYLLGIFCEQNSVPSTKENVKFSKTEPLLEEAYKMIKYIIYEWSVSRSLYLQEFGSH